MSSDFHTGDALTPAAMRSPGASSRERDVFCRRPYQEPPSFSHRDGRGTEMKGARRDLRCRQAMVTGAARDDGPDVDDLAVLDDMVCVVHVDSRWGVAGEELDDVADGDGAVGWWREAAMFLVEAEIGQIETGDRGKIRGGDRFVPGIDDDPLRRAADHCCQDAQRRLEPSLDTGVESVHQHIRAGLDLCNARS